VIRDATSADVPAIRPILAAHGNDGPVVTVDIVGPYLRHLIDHHRALVTVDGERVVAFGAAADAGVAHHLADLFVAPDFLGRGLGGQLLAALFGNAGRRTTFASGDPRALPLYVRAGMTPLWPILYLRGAGDAVPEPSPGIQTRDADAGTLSALEAAWTGHGRRLDHAYWAAAPEGDAFVVADRGEPVAFAYCRVRQPAPVRTIARLLVRPGAEPVGPILAAIRRAARGGLVHVGIPGPSRVLPILLGAGFRIEERDTFMASEAGLVDPARLVPDSGLLQGLRRSPGPAAGRVCAARRST